MKIVYPIKGKLSNYSCKNVYTDIFLKNNDPNVFFSEILDITSSTIKIEGNVVVYFNKYATNPELNIKTVNIHKGPAIIQVNVCTFKDSDLNDPNSPIEIGTPITPKIGYKFENKNINLKVIEIELADIDPLTNKPKTLKVAGIDDYAPYDIPINIIETKQNRSPQVKKELTPNLFIPQGTKYIMTNDSSSDYIFPVAFNMKNTSLKVQIYKNTDVTNTENLGDLLYENVFFCADKPIFFKSDINCLFLDTNVSSDSLCRYSVVASTNTATEACPVILQYATVSVSQIS